MFNYSNIPKWKDFFKIFSFSKNDINKKIKKIWGLYNKESINLFSKSSWSIFLIVALKLKKEPINIWVPSYYCEDAIYLIRKLNINIHYYEIDKNFIPEKSNLQKLLKQHKPDIIIYCHFFGKNCFDSYLKDISISSSSWLIEDATHCFFPENEIGKYGDFTIYSPYKFLPIPNGAIMTTSHKFIKDNNLEILLDENEQNLFLNSYFNFLTFTKTNNNLSNILWVIKRIINKFYLNFLNIKDFSYDQKIKNVNFFSHPKIDYFSKNLISTYIDKIEIEKEKRIRMSILWKKLINSYDEFKDLKLDLSFLENKQTPYFLIIKDSELKTVEKYNLFKKKNLPVLTWPNLTSDIPKFSNAPKLRKSLFFLPLNDQSLEVIKLIRKKENNLNNISLKQIDNQEDWDNYYNSISFSNISQSWSYGEAQKKRLNLKVKRYLISIDNLPKAIVQVLSKKFIFCSVNRINRGPLLLNGYNNLEQMSIILKLFDKFNELKSLNFLSFSPEIEFNEDNILLNNKNDSFYFNYPTWKSSTINLLDTEDNLRSKLDSKWRNMLNTSQKEGILIKEENSLLQLNKIIDLNIDDQKKKNFKGINSELLKNYLLSSNFIILSAYYNNEHISSICISLHGTTATYLIGWSNELGRKKKTMNLLLWNSIIYLKKNGYKIYDLGGVDKSVSYGIFKFKNDMGGKNYQLAGNYNSFSKFRLY